MTAEVLQEWGAISKRKRKFVLCTAGFTITLGILLLMDRLIPETNYLFLAGKTISILGIAQFGVKLWMLLPLQDGAVETARYMEQNCPDNTVCHSALLVVGGHMIYIPHILLTGNTAVFYVGDIEGKCRQNLLQAFKDFTVVIEPLQSLPESVLQYRGKGPAGPDLKSRILFLMM